VAVGATEGHFKALLCTIKYGLGTEDHGLLLLPQLNNEGIYLEGTSDSEYTGDPDTRISVYGYVLYFCGAPLVGNLRLGRVSPFHLLKLSTMPLQRYQEWKNLEFNYSIPSSSNGSNLSSKQPL
jgi:hypothetical protein